MRCLFLAKKISHKIIVEPTEKAVEHSFHKKSCGTSSHEKTVQPTKYLWSVLSTKLWNVWDCGI
jgi:hypothetical protein